MGSPTPKAYLLEVALAPVPTQVAAAAKAGALRAVVQLPGDGPIKVRVLQVVPVVGQGLGATFRGQVPPGGPRVPTRSDPAAQAPLRIGKPADGAARAASGLATRVGRAGRPVRVVGVADLVVGTTVAAVAALVGAGPARSAPT